MSCDPRTYPFIGHHEGKVLKAYRCPAGVITIGYGFTMGSRVFAAWAKHKWGRALKLGDALTADEAMSLLKNMIGAEYLPPVEEGAPNATPHAKGASTSMSFNCGPGSLKWKWFSALKAGKIKEAAERLRGTATTARGRRLPGLVRRRAEEAAILESNIWPSWLKPLPANPGGLAAHESIEAQMPAEPLQSDDYGQGLSWLIELGYLKFATGPYPEQTAAVRRFQSDHKQLTVDGIMGRATLDQMQRVVDLKRKAARTAAGGGTVSGTGAAEQVSGTDVLSGYGDFFLYGGLTVLVIGGLWLAFRYRDELKIAFKRRKPA
jgi:lysozyme